MTLVAELQHSFGSVSIDASLDVEPGVTAIFGPSGSGKTTLINMIAGLLKPDCGRIVLQGKVLLDTKAGISMPAHKRRIGYVFQDGRLFPHLTVAGNIRFGARFAAKTSSTQEGEVVELLGLNKLLSRLPGTLSGGEAQRVALARALLTQPELLLMDEPLAALDAPRKDEVLPYLEDLRAQTGVPILYVSHSVSEVARLADQMVLIRDGRVVLRGETQKILVDPAALPFIGVREAGSILHAHVLEHDPDGLTRLELSGGEMILPGVQASVGSCLTIRVLAQDVLLSLEKPRGLSSRNILPVIVLDLHRGEGPGVAVSLQLGDETLLARITARAADEMQLRPGLECFAILKATAIPRSSIGHVRSG